VTSFGLAGSKTSFEIRIRQLLPETFSFDSEFLTLRGGPWAKARGSLAGAIVVRAAKMVLLFSSAGYEGAQGRKDERKGGSGKDAGLVVLLVLARAVLRECAR